MKERKLDERFNLEQKNSQLLNWRKLFKRLHKEEKRCVFPAMTLGGNKIMLLGRAKLHPLLPPFNMFLCESGHLEFWSMRLKKEKTKQLPKNNSKRSRVRC